VKLPPIVSAQDWEFARERLLVKEKEVTRARDALAAERRRMPRVLAEPARGNGLRRDQHRRAERDAPDCEQTGGATRIHSSD